MRQLTTCLLTYFFTVQQLHRENLNLQVQLENQQLQNRLLREKLQQQELQQQQRQLQQQQQQQPLQQQQQPQQYQSSAHNSATVVKVGDAAPSLRPTANRSSVHVTPDAVHVTLQAERPQNSPTVMKEPINAIHFDDNQNRLQSAPPIAQPQSPDVLHANISHVHKPRDASAVRSHSQSSTTQMTVAAATTEANEIRHRDSRPADIISQNNLHDNLTYLSASPPPPPLPPPLQQRRIMFSSGDTADPAVKVGKIQWPPPQTDEMRPAVQVGRLDIEEKVRPPTVPKKSRELTWQQQQPQKSLASDKEPASSVSKLARSLPTQSGFCTPIEGIA